MNKIEIWQNTSLQDLPGEIWKDIEDFKGYYQISNMGRVKSLERKCIVRNGFTRKVKEKIRKQQFGVCTKRKTGRLKVMLCVKELNFRKHFGIPRLVMKYFSKEKSLNREVYHKNYNFCDNRISNLFYGELDDRSNMISQALNKKGRKSKYRGVVVRKEYLMNININKKTIREVFSCELKAAKRYDYYIKKYNLQREGNFINKNLYKKQIINNKEEKL